MSSKTESTPKVPAVRAGNTDGDVITGVASISLGFFGLALIGLIVGLIGAHVAKKNGRSPVLSRIGWIINLVFSVLFTLFIVLLVFIGITQDRDSAAKKDDMTATKTSLEAYYTDHNYYPGTLSDLGSSIPTRMQSADRYSGITYSPSPYGCRRCTSYILRTTLEPSSHSYTLYSTNY